MFPLLIGFRGGPNLRSFGKALKHRYSEADILDLMLAEDENVLVDFLSSGDAIYVGRKHLEKLEMALKKRRLAKH